MILAICATSVFVRRGPVLERSLLLTVSAMVLHFDANLYPAGWSLLTRLTMLCGGGVTAKPTKKSPAINNRMGLNPGLLAQMLLDVWPVSPME